MNPIFWILVILGGVGIWALLNIAFPAIGDIAIDMFNDVKRNLKKE